MSSWRIVRIVAGSFILISLGLGIEGSPVFISKWFLVFTAFVGVNLLQSGLTQWCLMNSILRSCGIKEGN
jgi:pheromone shutdown protein TraB